MMYVSIDGFRALRLATRMFDRSSTPTRRETRLGRCLGGFKAFVYSCTDRRIASCAFLRHRNGRVTSSRSWVVTTSKVSA